ncbi:MAG: vWA domain-containing protein, partial [Ostreibacterium sp.]
MNWDYFHFIRPEWLWALLPAGILLGLLWRLSTMHSNDWSRYVDAHLLQHLAMKGQQDRRLIILPIAILFSVGLAIMGVSGPTWEKFKVPSFSGGESTMIVLSLAQSMNTDDIKPSRLQRAIHKIRDILAKTQGQDRGLVIYADTAFTATPLTNDAQVIEQMLPELSTTLMPALGNRLDLAIDKATNLLKRGNAVYGQIIILTDNAGEVEKTEVAATAAKQAGYTVSIIGVGSVNGGTLQTANGLAITNGVGHTVLSQLAEDDLKMIAKDGGGQFALSEAGDGDLNQVLINKTATGVGNQQDFKTDRWQDRGYWLLIFPLLVLPFLFRRGVVFSLVFAFSSLLLVQPQTAQASELWNNLWQTPNQQGQTAFDKGDYGKAGKRFANIDWQASTAYKAGNYKKAAKIYEQQGQHYNQGNALAKSGDLKGALAAYNSVLKVHPKDQNAQFNREVVKKLLEKQQQNKQQQNKQQQNKQQQNKQQQNKQQQ